MMHSKKGPPISKSDRLLASSSSTSKSESTLGKKPQAAKRKALDDEEDSAHDKEGSEYLRRKHNFIRTTIRTDYQPDICKDYKETGFCGFGDSCKFLHDRSDYKHGWQLDQEYAKGQYKEEDDDKYLIKEEDEERTEDGIEIINGIPARCSICKDAYKNPIVTVCKHYFCMACAEKECESVCRICEKPTLARFKNATKIIRDKLKSNQD